MSRGAKTSEDLLQEHPLLAGSDSSHCAIVSGCARNMAFKADQYLFREGGDADQFHLIREGRVALELNSPGRDPLTFQTLTAGDVVGVSWLIPPYRWAYDARALEPSRVISIDAACLRNKCEADHDLGYDMMKRFMPLLLRRLHAARLQIADVYDDRP